MEGKRAKKAYEGRKEMRREILDREEKVTVWAREAKKKKRHKREEW